MHIFCRNCYVSSRLEASWTRHLFSHEAAKLSKLDSIKRRESQADARVQARLRARTQIRKGGALKNCAAFESVAAASIDTIVNTMELATYEPGRVVCAQGALADRMFVIIKGDCQVFLMDADGKQRQLGQLSKLAVFGESALFGRQPKRVATVQVLEGGGRLEVMELTTTTFQKLLESGALPPDCLAALRSLQQARLKEHKKEQ